MFTKFLFMSGAAHAPVRAGRHTRARVGASYFPAANIRCVPRLHAPLECRWRLDAATGTLSSFWMNLSANTR